MKAWFLPQLGALRTGLLFGNLPALRRATSAMDCTTCTPTPARKDRPHTFLAHEYASCPACETRIEGRIVLRAGKVHNLLRCVQCGPQEVLVSEDSGQYLEAFLAKGRVPEGHAGDWLFKTTTSTCPSCLALLEAEVVIREGKVFFKKACGKCGPSEALVSE